MKESCRVAASELLCCASAGAGAAAAATDACVGSAGDPLVAGASGGGEDGWSPPSDNRVLRLQASAWHRVTAWNPYHPITMHECNTLCTLHSMLKCRCFSW